MRYIFFCSFLFAFVAAEPLKEKLEKELHKIVSQSTTFGFYEGQTKSLHKLGAKICDPLLDLYTNPEYKYSLPSLQLDRESALKVKMLSGQALRESIFLYNEKQKKKIIAELTFFLQNPFLDHQFQVTSYTILYDLQATKIVQGYLDLLNTKMRVRPHRAESFVEAGYFHMYIKKYSTALSYFFKAQKIRPEDHNIYYYIAICYSMQGKVKDAMQALRTTVEKGFRDVSWMESDRDLVNLHNLPEFKKFIEESRKKRYK